MNEEKPPVEDILDVAPPVSVPEVTPWWIYALVILAVVLLVTLLFVWLRKRKQPEFALSPKEKALRLLESLRDRAANLDGRDFGVAVSDVMRVYLTEGRGLRATKQTSREFLAELSGKNLFTTETQVRLKEFLEACDYLKYAPVGQATEPNRNLLEQASRFIRSEA